MCPPDYFGIEYEINPWMNVRVGSDAERSRQQWTALRRDPARAGRVGRPDRAGRGPARPGLHGQRRAGLSRSLHQLAVPVSASGRASRPTSRAGRELGVSRSSTCRQGYHFEGAGDALFCGETLFAGYRFRSDVRSHQWVGERLGVEVLPLELVDPRFYHLDTCFCPLAPDWALYYPGAFDEYGRSVLRDRIPNLIEVAAEEAVSFSCNAVVVGRTVVLERGGAEAGRDAPRARVHGVRLLGFSEFIKSGGSAKCLTLRLDGEEAASWKTETA